MDETAFKVEFDDISVTCTRPDGGVENVEWDKLESITVEATKQEGAPPFIWILWGEGRKSGCIFPGMATGSAELQKKLKTKLEHFDSKALSDALSSPENRTYTIWQKEIVPDRDSARFQPDD